MATTKEDIAGWFREGQQQGATHMIVACDTFDWEDYPVFVMPGEDVREKAAEHEKVMEVYSLSQDMDAQLNEYRAFHYD
ncbi:MAG: hypothetical protein HYS44_01585 [Candidatus Niyogibacteria bacterium]|nr:hypothetical protein [Candidatus Niyogibacteria bacterium]